MQKRRGINSRLVDDHDVTVLAVAVLGAVDPDGSGAVDHDGVDGDHAHGGAGGDGQEARVEARHVAVRRDGLARVVKGGLGDGVVARGELELHRLAGGHAQVVGLVRSRAVLGHDDDVGLDFLGCVVGCVSWVGWW